LIKNRLIILFSFLTSLGASACSGPGLIGNPQMPYPLSAPAEVGQIVHMPTGILVSEDEMLDIASRNRIVYVGETHDNPASHRLQLKVLKAMTDRYPGKVAVGMEMFTPAQNEALEQWINGDLSEKEFLRAAGWFTVWKGDYEYYRALLNFAREKKIPVIGLNAEKKAVRLVVADKTEELTEAEKQIVAKMDLDDPYQRGLVEGIYGGHVKSEGMLDGFHRAQTLWDETMAESVASFLNQEEHRDFHMVVIAGGNHIRYGFGIPRRVFRRLPSTYTLIGGKEIEIPESKRDKLMDVTLPQFPMVPYDFMVFTRYEELEKKGVKLGVMFSDTEDQVSIKMVAPGSNAERAGIEEGDTVIAIDGEKIVDKFDVFYSIGQKMIGDRSTVTIKRDDKIMELDVSFSSKPENE